MAADRRAEVRRPAGYKTERMAWGELTWFASHELGNAEGVTVGRCIIKPGCRNPLHYHPNCEEVLHVLQGRILHRVEEGREVQMAAGDTITIPPNLLHGAANVGVVDAVLLICYSSAERETRGE